MPPLAEEVQKALSDVVYLHRAPLASIGTPRKLFKLIYLGLAGSSQKTKRGPAQRIRSRPPDAQRERSVCVRALVFRSRARLPLGLQRRPHLPIDLVCNVGIVDEELPRILFPLTKPQVAVRIPGTGFFHHA